MNGRRPANDESGATLAIVAICLVVILGMAALVVDVGGMLVARRHLVLATDAAALASAGSCVRGQLDDAAQADTYAADNVSGAVRDAIDDSTCTQGTGSVSVAYHVDQPLFFAPVLGFGRTQTITARATASWQPAGIAPAIPIEVSTTEGVFPCMDQAWGTDCNYWHDNNNVPLPNDSDWGFMNFDQWDVPARASCHNPGVGSLEHWIRFGQYLTLADPGPTYVCVSHGHEMTTWATAVRADIGKLEVFPVNDPDQAIRANGVQKYAIVGFAELRVKNVLRGDGPAGLQACPGHAADSNAVCVVATWEGFQIGGQEGQGGLDFGLRVLRLSS